MKFDIAYAKNSNSIPIFANKQKRELWSRFLSFIYSLFGK